VKPTKRSLTRAAILVSCNAGDDGLSQAALYAVPRYKGGTEWDRLDRLRMWLAPLAFVGWTLIQPIGMFDAVSELTGPPRTVIALFLGAVVALSTPALALEAEKKDPQRKRAAAR